LHLKIRARLLADGPRLRAAAWPYELVAASNGRVVRVAAKAVGGGARRQQQPRDAQKLRLRKAVGGRRARRCLRATDLTRRRAGTQRPLLSCPDGRRARARARARAE